MILYIHKKRGEKRTMSYDELLEKYNILNAKYENVKLENQNLRRIIYGVKREYTPKQEQVENCMQCSGAKIFRCSINFQLKKVKK